MKKQLFSIVNNLILNTSSMSDLGLYHGKMGTVLFFVHYARCTNNSLYDDFAGKILDEIYEDIHTETPIYFSNGLCGIAWSIEYLLQEGFMEGESDEILSDLDEKIMKWDPRRISDFTLETGLEGIIWYVLSRLMSPRIKGGHPFDDRYLRDIRLACKKIKQSTDEYECVSALLRYMEHQEITYSLSDILKKVILISCKNQKEKLLWLEGIKLIAL